MNLARLNRLVVVLEEVAADPKKVRDFDMGTWAKITPDCGTHACACGWGALDPVLNAEGLSVVELYKDFAGHARMELAYGTERGFFAAQMFFGISMWDANHLFDESEYVSGDDDDDDDEDRERVEISTVIARIKQFISDNQEPTT